MMDEQGLLAKAGASGVSSVMAPFFAEAMQHITVWLVVMFSVIVCDCAAAVRKHAIMKDERLSFSRGVRHTIGKCVMYFAFVVMVVCISVASGIDGLDRWACMLVIFIESCSIMSNILSPKGIELNVFAAIVAYIGRRTGMTREEISEVISKDVPANCTRRRGRRPKQEGMK